MKPSLRLVPDIEPPTQLKIEAFARLLYLDEQENNPMVCRTWELAKDEFRRAAELAYVFFVGDL